MTTDTHTNPTDTRSTHTATSGTDAGRPGTTPGSASGRARWTAVGGLLGVAFAVVTLGKIGASPMVPAFDEPVAELRAFWEDDGTAYLVSQYVGRLAMIVLFVPFLVALTTRIAEREHESRPLSRLVLVSGALQVVLLLAADAAWGALGASAESLSDDAIVALTQLDRGAFQATGFTAGLFLLAAAVGIARTGAVWRWLGYVGGVIGVASLVAPLSIVSDDPEGPLVFIGFFATASSLLWILLTGLGLAVAARRDREPA